MYACFNSYQNSRKDLADTEKLILKCIWKHKNTRQLKKLVEQ